MVNRANWLWNSAGLFVTGFCSLIDSISFVRWPWPCTRHKRYSNAYEQRTSQNIWTNTLDKTMCTVIVRSTKGVFIIYERGGMGENLKISIFFLDLPPKYLKKISVPPPQVKWTTVKVFLKKCQDAVVLFDKMYHICLKSIIDCMWILLLKY